MKQIAIIILAVVGVSMIACSRQSGRQNETLDEVETLIVSAPDSALTILETIDLSELNTDSIRARYIYLQALGHMHGNRSMIADSLIRFAHEFYRGKDVVRDVGCCTALAWYKFWVGDTPGAITILDSIADLGGVPDSVMVQTLRVRSLLGASEYQGEPLIPLAKKLIGLETDPRRQLEAKYVLVCGYENAGKMDSALMLIDELIDTTPKSGSELSFQLMLERAQVLTELGRNTESEAVVDYIFQHAGPENGAADYLHMNSAINALNTGNVALASKEIAIADSLAMKLRPEENSYYRSYSNLIHTMIDFKQNGKMKFKHVNSLNNRQRERFNRMKASQWESERGALEQQSRALALKAESQHKTVIILVIVIISVLLLTMTGFIIRYRRQRELENEERVEALQKMVDELKSTPATQPAGEETPVALRRAMLQQLGIIKMVAETPTEQNREMLRKISAIDGETNGELVNWKNVYELIDNLYSGFYRKMHARYDSVLSNKEEQIIVLMVAGFSTKEISVITGQTTATIYVRKSSIRKKLGLPEKEDIVSFLRADLAR